MSMLGLFLGVSLALLYSLGIAGVVYRMAGQRSAASNADALALGIGAAPFIAGLVTVAAIALLGVRSDAIYILVQFSAAGVLTLISARPIQRMGCDLWKVAAERIHEAPSLLRIVFRIETLLAAVLLLQITWLTYLVLVVPLIGNDPLEYAMVAKVLYERRSFDAYPLIEADPATGMYAPWTHPPLYVAQIFLAYMLQGGGELPGLMRLISLYCTCAVVLVLSRIAVRAQPGVPGRHAALLTAIVVLATPLVRSMTVEASIDTLPILGLTLVFAAASLLSWAPLKARIALTGAAMGLSLWAHSSAILFPILAVVGISTMRWFQRKPFAAECAGILLLGGALGFLPYLRNQLIFGSPISDMPAVFALPQLDWHSYFSIGRGMSTMYDMIVVGVLRGWTAYSDFWLTFWFMSAGIALVLRDRLLSRAPDPGQAALIGALAIVIAFHAGMLLSVVLGTSLMIKNARYLLAVLPFASLLAGFALSRIADVRSLVLTERRRTENRITIELQFNPGWRGQALSVVLLIGILYLAAEQVASSMTSWRTYLVSLRGSLWEPQRATLAKFPFYRVQEHMQQALPPQALVLSLRPADLYYAKHRMISYLDPRLAPAYKEDDPGKLSERLHKLGVTHVYKGNYSLPVIYNSALMRLLTDQQLSRVVHSDGNYAVYQLNPAPAERLKPSRTWNISPARYPWTGYSEAQIPFVPGLCQTEGVRVDSAAPQPTIRNCSWAPARRAVYVSGTGPPHDSSAKYYVRVEPGGTYRYTVEVTGNGALRILVYEKRGPLISVQQIDDAILTKATRKFTGMFRLPDDVTHIRFALSMEGAGELSIHDVVLEALEGGATTSGAAATSNDAADPRMSVR